MIAARSERNRLIRPRSEHSKQLRGLRREHSVAGAEWIPMKTVVFAEQFRSGSWNVWEHACTRNEVEAVFDSAFNRAHQRSAHGQPVHDDFLEGARSIFNVTLGTAESPRDGDTRVYCVCMGQVVIGVYEKVRRYSQRVMENHDFVGVELKKSA
jgi:hypothetical protein